MNDRPVDPGAHRFFMASRETLRRRRVARGLKTEAVLEAVTPDVDVEAEPVAKPWPQEDWGVVYREMAKIRAA